MSWILTEVGEDSCVVNPSSDRVNLNSLPMKLRGRGAAFWSVWWTDIQQHQGTACNERERERWRGKDVQHGILSIFWCSSALSAECCVRLSACDFSLWRAGGREGRGGCRTRLFCAAMWTEPYPKMSLKWSLHYRESGSKAVGIKQAKSNVVLHTLEAW